MSDAARKARFYDMVRQVQEQTCETLRQLDPGIAIIEDVWQRRDHRGDDGGCGHTRAVSGAVIENGGVNVSRVFGAVSTDFSRTLGGSEDDTLWAAGVSIILHPRNPHVPSFHANFRMIGFGRRIWFGGGSDLTPYFPHEDDFIHFHRAWAQACAPYQCYAEMKAACDAYFVNHHRDHEMRGIGGIFFDQFDSGDPEHDMLMVDALATAMPGTYFPIVERRMGESWSDEDECFQLHRRGRYVEFNLLHDRGTHFGLRSGGRTESILISLPARCRFGYAFAPRPDTPQATMMGYYRPIDWVHRGDQKAPA